MRKVMKLRIKYIRRPDKFKESIFKLNNHQRTFERNPSTNVLISERKDEIEVKNFRKDSNEKFSFKK